VRIPYRISLRVMPTDISSRYYRLILIYFPSEADPVAFRFHIGGVKSRLMNLRSPLRTPEIDYDYYYQDDCYSACKSTEKKVAQAPSNSHIYFTSPLPGTTPVKMSPLCELDDDDEAVLVVEMQVPESIASPSPVHPSAAAASMAAAAVRREQEQLASPASPDIAVPDCPTTPSVACFQAAFSVIKSAKKSPFISRKSTPCKVITEPTPQQELIQDTAAIAEVAVPVPEEVAMVVEAEVECAPEVQDLSAVAEQVNDTPYMRFKHPWENTYSVL
jgi:hypothetical protein